MYLFIDDERFPPNDGKEWTIARTSQEAIDIINKHSGEIEFISFDHDLGMENFGSIPQTTRSVVRHVINNMIDMLEDGLYPEHVIRFPSNFDFYVHSQNPIGAKWIRENMIDVLKLNEELWKGE